MFCSTGKAETLKRVAEAARVKGRWLGRGPRSARWRAPVAGLDIDYTNDMETRTRYEKRPDRYDHLVQPGDPKRMKVTSYGVMDRVVCKGWWATIPDGGVVNVFGDLEKMDRDLTHLMLSGDLEIEAKK